MDEGAPTIVEHGGMTIQSVGVSESDAKAALAEYSPEETPKGEEKSDKAEKPAKLSKSDHARELGKLGGKAAAEKRAEAQEAKPAEAPEKPEAKVDTEGGGGTAVEEEGEDDDAPLSKRAQRRIEVATRKQAEARRAAEAAEARARALEAELAAHRVRQATEQARDGAGERREPPSRDQDGPPREEDFEKFSDYLDARDDYKRKGWERDLQRRQHAEKEVAAIRGYVDDFLKHVPKEMVAELDPELVEMRPYHFMEEGEPLTGDNLIATELMYLRGEAPAVLKHLTKYPQGIEALRRLFDPSDPRGSHMNIRVAVQRLAGYLGSRSDATAGDPPEKGEQAAKPARSKANPPVRPVTGAPHVADGDPAPRESEDFDAWNRRQKRA